MTLPGGDGLGLAGAVLGLVGTVAAAIVARASEALKRAHELELQGIRDTHANDVKTLSEAQKRAEDGLKAAWVKIDDLRENAVRKAELKEYRAELKNDIKELGDRLERSMHEAIEGLRRAHQKEGS